MLRLARPTGWASGSVHQKAWVQFFQVNQHVFKSEQSTQHRKLETGDTPEAADKATGTQTELQQQHWLDRYFPGARQWLENKNREWWIKGLVEARGKQFHQLEGRKDLLRSSIELQYKSLHERHAHLAVDDRSETHLQVACLAMGTYRVLMPFLKDEQEVLEVIREHMGGRTSPALSFLMKAVRFMHRDPYATLSGRLRGLQRDYGAGFDSSLQLGEVESTLTISSCFYERLFRQEGLPQLTTCSCCTQDQVWLQGVQYPGVEAGLCSSRARGDALCCFRVHKVGSGGGERSTQPSS